MSQAANRLVQPFLHSSCQSVVGHAQTCLSPNNCPFHMRDLGLIYTRFLGPTRVHKPNGIWTGLAVFEQLTAEHPYTLQWATLFPENCRFQWGDLHPILYMIPWDHPSSQPKWHLDWFRRFCTALRRVSL